MIYYGRPFSYNPTEARARYQIEAETLHRMSGELVVCTIPLTDYDFTLTQKTELEIFYKAAKSLISSCDLFIYKDGSPGVDIEKEIAGDLGKPMMSYGEYLDYHQEIRLSQILRERDERVAD